VSQKTKLFLTILARYLAVSFLSWLVALGVLTPDDVSTFEPWLIEGIVSGLSLVAMAILAWYATRQRFYETEAAKQLQPYRASDEAVKDLARLLKKEGAL
jgi:hypothetical protein